jgi:uncharacterized damage-inducible protein DinB
MKARHDSRPPTTGPSEKDVLLGFLDYLRASVASKVEGVPEPQVRTPGVASGTNLLGLVKHLTHVERHWLLGQEVTNWPATFHPTPDETTEALLATYRETTTRANEVITACTDLTEPAPRPTTRGTAPSMRWTLTHLIEETGRHAGHTDILRELIDGTTGR